MTEIVKKEVPKETPKVIQSTGTMMDNPRTYTFNKNIEKIYNESSIIDAIRNKKLSRDEIINYLHYYSAFSLVEFYRRAGLTAPADILFIALSQDVNNISDDEVILLQKAYGEDTIAQIYLNQGKELPKALSFGQSFLGFFGRLFNHYDKVTKNSADMNSLRRSKAMRGDIAQINELYNKSKAFGKTEDTIIEMNKLTSLQTKMNITFVKDKDMEEADLNALQDKIVEKIKDKIDKKDDSSSTTDTSKKDDKTEIDKVGEKLNSDDTETKTGVKTETKTADKTEATSDIYALFGKYIVMKNPQIKHFSGIRRNISMISSKDIVININGFGKYVLKDADFQVLYDGKNDTRVAEMKGSSLELSYKDFTFKMENIRFNSADDAFCPQTTSLTYNVKIDDANSMAVSGRVGDLRISKGDISFKSFAVGVPEFSFLDGMFTGKDVMFFMGRKNKEETDFSKYAMGLAIGELGFEYKSDDKSLVNIKFSSDESGKSDIMGISQILDDTGITASYLFTKNDTGKFGLELNKAKFDIAFYNNLVAGAMEDVNLKDTIDGKSFRAGKTNLTVNVDVDSVKLTAFAQLNDLEVSRLGTKFSELSVGLNDFTFFNGVLTGSDAKFVMKGMEGNYAKSICLGSLRVNAGENFDFKLESNKSDIETEKGHWALVQTISGNGNNTTSKWEPDIKDASATITMFKVVTASANKINYKDKIFSIGKSSLTVKIDEPKIDGFGEMNDMSYDFNKKDFNFSEISVGVNEFSILDGMLSANNAVFTITKENESYIKNINIKSLGLKVATDYNAKFSTKEGSNGWNVGQNKDNQWYVYVNDGIIDINTELFDLNANNININDTEKNPGLKTLNIEEVSGLLKVFEEQTGGIKLGAKGLELKDKTLDYQSIYGSLEKLELIDGISLISPKFEISKIAKGRKIFGNNNNNNTYNVNIESGFSANLGKWGNASAQKVALSLADRKFDSFKIDKPSLKLFCIDGEIKADSIDVLKTETQNGIKASNLAAVLTKKPDGTDSTDAESSSLLDYLGIDGLTATIDEISYINQVFKLGKPKFSLEEITIGKNNKYANLKIGLGDKKYIRGAVSFEFPGSDYKGEKTSGQDLTSEPVDNKKEATSKDKFPAGIDPSAFGAKDYTPPEIFGMNFPYPLIPGVLSVHAGFGFGAGINVYGILEAALGKAEENNNKKNDNGDTGVNKIDFSGTLGFVGALWAAAKLGAEAGLTNVLTINADFLAKLGFNVKAGANAKVTITKEKQMDKYNTGVSNAEINFGITSELILALLGKVTTKVLFFKERTLYEKKFKEWQLGAFGFAGKAIYEKGNKLKMQDIKKGMTINGKDIGSIKNAKDLKEIELEDVNKKTVDIQNDRKNAEKLLLDLKNYQDVPGIGAERKSLAELVNNIIEIYDKALKEASKVAENVSASLVKAEDEHQQALDDTTTNKSIQKRKMRLEFLYSQRGAIEKHKKENSSFISKLFKKSSGTNGENVDSPEETENKMADSAIEKYKDASYVTQEYLNAAFIASFYGYTRYRASKRGDLKSDQKYRLDAYKASIKTQGIPYAPDVFYYDLTTAPDGSMGYSTYNLASRMDKYFDAGTYTISSNFYDILEDKDTLKELMDFGRNWVLKLVAAGGSGLTYGDNDFNDSCNLMVTEFNALDDYSLRYRLLKDELGDKKTKSKNFLKTGHQSNKIGRGTTGTEKLNKIIEYEEQNLFLKESERTKTGEYLKRLKVQKQEIDKEISEINSILIPLKTAASADENALDMGSKNKNILLAVKKGCEHIEERNISEEKAKKMKRDPALFLLSRSKK